MNQVFAAAAALLVLGTTLPGAGGCDTRPDTTVAPALSSETGGAPVAATRPDARDARAELRVLGHAKVRRGTSWQVQGTLQNRGPHRYVWVTIRLRLLDTENVPVGETSCGLGEVLPGETRAFTALALDEAATGYRITAVEGMAARE